MSTIVTVASIVRELAQQELLPRFAQVGREWKADGSLVTEADRAMQQRLAMALAEHWPELPLLGEEMSEQEQQALWQQPPAAGFWCLDPLDGTSNFAAGMPFFAVSLARIRDGQPDLGVVYDPLRDRCYYAEAEGGAWCHGERLVVPTTGRSLAEGIAIVDLKRLSPSLATRLVTAPPFASQRNLGASALEWCLLAAGHAELYLHGRQQPWDYAAGLLILQQAGGVACTLQGEAVWQGELRPSSVVAAADPALFAAWCHWLGIEPTV